MTTHTKFLITILLVVVLGFQANSTFAATIRSKNPGGEWSDPTSWLGNKAPEDGDIVVIQSGHTITITNTSIGSSFGRQNLTITINGTLSLVYTNGPFSLGWAAMYLTSASTISIPSGGQLNSTSNYFLGDLNFISIGTGLPNIPPEYSGLLDGTIDGPESIDENGILPIELISFNANLTCEIVNISWATASETNNDFFTLERSNDAVNWSVIGEVAGGGNSTIRNDYAYLDHNPIPGLSYYKLKQTDYDGQFEYFTPVVVLYEPDNLFKVFPNPTADVLQISTSSDLSNASIFVKNLNGQAERVEIDASSHQATLDVSSLPTGVYLLEIVFPESVLSKKIIKK